MTEQLLTDALCEAIASHWQLPAFPEKLTLDDAYGVQRDVVARISGSCTAGLKAGLTNPQVQKMLGVDHGLLGCLYGHSETSGDIALPAGSLVESEIGIVIDNTGRPLSVGPAIEFVHVPFARREDFSAPNLVACNMGANQFIKGPQLKWRENWAGLTAKLNRDGQLLQEAKLTDSLDGPAAALAWMLKEAQYRQYPLHDGMLLMTGTCGQALPAEKGSYQADYGELGIVRFRLV